MVIGGCEIRPYTVCPNANLSGANLIGAYLTRADLSEADLSGVNLSSARFCRTTMPNGNQRTDPGQTC